MKLLTSACLLASVLLGAPAHAAEEPAAPPCSALIAHRGGVFPGITENSMDAIRQSVALGAVTFEVDLRTTATNTLAVMHDATVDATTSSTGRVSKMTAVQMRAVKLDDGQRVPNARMVLRFIAMHPGVDVVLHLKRMTPASWDRLQRGIHTWGARPGGHNIEPQITLMGSAGMMTDAGHALAALNAVQLDQVPGPVVAHARGVAIATSYVTPGLVASTHAGGRSFWVFSPDASSWSKVAADGADAMFVNDVAGYLGACS